MTYSQLLNLARANVYIDTFSGCGGSALGMREAGWHGLFAIEKDPMAFETLYMNFLRDDAPYRHFEIWPDWLPKEPHTMEAVLADPFYRAKLLELRGKVSLVMGGPPCQGFSVGGARNGTDARNELIFKLIEMVELVRPPLVLIENVVGITRAFNSRPGKSSESVASVAIRSLQDLGYSADYVIVDTTAFGVPQTRERVIIFAVVNELVPDINVALLLSTVLASVTVQQRAELGLPLDRPVNIEEAIHDLAGTEKVACPDAPEFDSALYLAAKSTYARLMRDGLETGTIPNSHRFSKHGDKVKALYVKAHETQKPGRLSRAFLLANGTKTHKKFLLDPTRPASTLTTHPDEFIHYKYPRNVSLREMARIQSIPDRFWLYGRYTLNGDRRGLDVSRCAQVGNAIPPLLARGLGIALIEIIERLTNDTLGEELQLPVQLSLF